MEDLTTWSDEDLEYELATFCVEGYRTLMQGTIYPEMFMANGWLTWFACWINECRPYVEEFRRRDPSRYPRREPLDENSEGNFN